MEDEPVRYAGVGVRFVATLVDWLIIGLVTAPFADFHTSNSPDFSVRIHYGGPGAAVSWLLAIAYFIVLEGTVGATVGKLLVGIRVRAEDGTPISFGPAAVRNVLRVIDIIPYFLPYLLGAILVWSSPRKQRLGDRAAHTVVVARSTEPFGLPRSEQTYATEPAGSFPPLPPPPPAP